MSVHHSFELVSGMSLGPKASFDHLRFALNGSSFCRPSAGGGEKFAAQRARVDGILSPMIHGESWRKTTLAHFYNVRPPRYLSWLTKAPVTKVIRTINHSEMGVMCTNLDIDRGPHIVPPQNKQPSNCLAICGTHHTGDLRSILCFSLLEGAPRGWRSMAAVHCRMGLHDVTWWVKKRQNWLIKPSLPCKIR
jgi:hypothetical protein